MPAAGNETMYSNNTNPTASTVGGLAVGVPGELRGWEALHKRHGKLPWSKVYVLTCTLRFAAATDMRNSFQPAIKLARDGFKVNPDLAAALSNATYPFLLKDPLFAETYAPNGTLLRLNDTVYRKRYADTLETLATHGADAFYSGRIAVNTAEAALARGGILTTKDLAGYEAILRTPANITYRDKYRIFSTVAPSSGAVVLSALKIFEGYDGSAELNQAAINETTHRLIQATRFGYGSCLSLILWDGPLMPLTQVSARTSVTPRSLRT
jgi:gamma-glutamyltranspeptidase/glutathione hydrolase